MLGYDASQYITIQENTDLNDLVTPGVYFCNTAAIAQTLENCPLEYGFKLIVERATADTRVISQKIFAYNFPNPDFNAIPFVRGKNSQDQWSDWRKLATNREIGSIRHDSHLISSYVANVDNPSPSFILQTHVDYTTGSLPDKIGGNTYVMLQSNPSTRYLQYNSQLAFGFGADKIALRRRNNSDWTNWKYFTFPTLEVADITSDSGTVNVNCVARKFGNVVIANIYIVLTSDVEVYENFANIPFLADTTGKANQYFGAAMLDEAPIRIYAAGNSLFTYRKLTTGNVLFGSITYFTT